MVDAVMISSKSSNCQEDIDTFVFTLTKAKDEKQPERTPEVLDNSNLTKVLEIPDCVKSLLTVAVQSSDVNEDNATHLQ